MKGTKVCKLGNSPNSALHSNHVTLATGGTLRDKCLDNHDNVSCFSVAWVRPALPMTELGAV